MKLKNKVLVLVTNYDTVPEIKHLSKHMDLPLRLINDHNWSLQLKFSEDVHGFLWGEGDRCLVKETTRNPIWLLFLVYKKDINHLNGEVTFRKGKLIARNHRLNNKLWNLIRKYNSLVSPNFASFYSEAPNKKIEALGYKSSVLFGREGVESIAVTGEKGTSTVWGAGGTAIVGKDGRARVGTGGTAKALQGGEIYLGVASSGWVIPGSTIHIQKDCIIHVVLKNGEAITYKTGEDIFENEGYRIDTDGLPIFDDSVFYNFF